ncbi:MAG: 16S rRNA (cytidine(1402)-2'-O)-methyltransferase [Ruminococcaceae bacterium]|nr:16S rRNA (cytidine(1402)-2'-O)-methyltransferase [Oscillospiraceae bacterium]
MTGTLYVCATPIGNLSDVSDRLRQTLEAVDLVAAEDTRHTGKLLQHLGITKPCISYFTHNRRGHGEMIVKELLSGKNVALVSDAGTPAISDPGEELVQLCAAAGVPTVPIPGPCAAISALSVSGLITGRFVFEGFLSTQKKGRMDRLEALKTEERTIIFYEAPHKLVRTLEDFAVAFGPARKITLCREMTKIFEEIIRTTVGEALERFTAQPPKGEFVLVVEGAPEIRESWEDLSIEAHVNMYEQTGLSRMDAIKRVAADRGVPKREIYDAVMR